MRYDEARFRATHNSYSGNIHGRRGSIVQQLDAGVRCLELDFHDAGYPRVGDYRLGHGLGPGSDVSHAGGNPAKGVLGLRQWLALLTRWSALEKNADHAPITLILDM